jgi:hypothetical protein
VLSTFAREAAGALDAPGIPCALSIFEGGNFHQNSRGSCGEKESVCLVRLVIASVSDAIQ